jgi:hypothetical protein
MIGRHKDYTMAVTSTTSPSRMWPAEKGKAVGDEGLVEERQQPGRTSSDSALILNTSGLQTERRHMTKQRKFFNSQQKEPS